MESILCQFALNESYIDIMNIFILNNCITLPTTLKTPYNSYNPHQPYNPQNPHSPYNPYKPPQP